MAEATFNWTYPLTNVQLVYSDGKNVNTVDLPQNSCKNFSAETFQIEFPKGMKWARVLAIDIAGNSVFGMPIFLQNGEVK